ncbi:MAG: sulfurase [Arcobacter sp.]|uniref:MOSC domain-containing protein n=1 Tax=uncultured Arcobacter sp. TaxID=165434 RepID=UPI000CAE5C3A|nr:MOSC domain-containing protein [uncultured Arcobacter sp.]PLY09214.1 MAG: sulfurase [Arcobacter sp.]
MSGKISNLLISKSIESSMQNVNQVVLEVGKGIFGDRYYNQEGTFSNKGTVEPDRDVTLIEIENINALNEEHNLSITPEDFRRNIVVSNCDLNSLVDKEFQIGEVILKGIRLCEPCKYLADKLAEQKTLTQMVHKAGLRAEIIKGGSIDLNCQIEVL